MTLGIDLKDGGGDGVQVVVGRILAALAATVFPLLASVIGITTPSPTITTTITTTTTTTTTTAAAAAATTAAAATATTTTTTTTTTTISTYQVQFSNHLISRCLEKTSRTFVIANASSTPGYCKNKMKSVTALEFSKVPLLILLMQAPPGRYHYHYFRRSSLATTPSSYHYRHIPSSCQKAQLLVSR